MHQRTTCGRSISFVIALAAVLVLSGAAWADWSAPTFFSTSKTYEYLSQSYPDVVEGPDGTLHAVWSVYERSSAPYPATQMLIGLKYARSADGGATWSAPVDLASTSFMYSTYRGARILAGENGRLHVTYYYLNYYGYSTVNYMRSDDNGQTWTTNWLQSGCFPWFISPALDEEGNVFTAWERWKCNNSTLPSTVFVSRSLDNGTTWSGALGVSPGGVIQVGYQLSPSLAADGSGGLHLVYENPADAYSPGYGLSRYAVSRDHGQTWTSQTMHDGFGVTGIHAFGSTVLATGLHDGLDAFLRSGDGGVTWEGPLALPQLPGGWPVSQMAIDQAGAYHAWKDQSSIRSADAGQTWSSPDYMGNGIFSRIVPARNGDLFAVGQFPCNTGDSCVGLVKYREPFGVDAPAFASYWEKASFTYAFSVRGTGTVRASFPRDAVALAPGTAVTVGDLTVPAEITVEGDRIVASFPAESADWTSCSLPISVTKGAMEKQGSVRRELARLDAEFRSAVEAEDAERAERIAATRRDLEAELTSAEREFVVSIAADGQEKASDRTAVSIYERLTSVYMHLKASAGTDGAELVLKTADTISVGVNQPFMLEVKVTHLKVGQPVSVSLSGGSSEIDAILSNAVGTHKSTYYLFYPPSFSGTNDDIQVSVTIDGVTAVVPLHVVLH